MGHSVLVQPRRAIQHGLCRQVQGFAVWRQRGVGTIEQQKHVD